MYRWLVEGLRSTIAQSVLLLEERENDVEDVSQEWNIFWKRISAINRNKMENKLGETNKIRGNTILL